MLSFRQKYWSASQNQVTTVSLDSVRMAGYAKALDSIHLVLRLLACNAIHWTITTVIYA